MFALHCCSNWLCVHVYTYIHCTCVNGVNESVLFTFKYAFFCASAASTPADKYIHCIHTWICFCVELIMACSVVMWPSVCCVYTCTCFGFL